MNNCKSKDDIESIFFHAASRKILKTVFTVSKRKGGQMA